ncbi:DUF3307 domain-containing protein [Curtobacterium sp. ZW137]|uniref:DUF3307 domain-containing protein n=1 Tax=Curtobacterium sp. ZW137 TaxID=2485104 RepID=UPI000F4C51A1|nr:DUF3307 domain-containing protein [Curtobacterium sp. ZW137]ROP65644.1 uncharacterized protein DUF3307 [Curtobacterium sp. ZW137]
MLGLAVILAHLLGDYLLQTDSMAQRKTSSWRWALTHAAMYSLPHAVLLFVLLGGFSWHWLVALLIIGGTHAVIDRYRLAKHVIWALNHALPHDHRDEYAWAEARENAGYSPSSPVWMRTWLMIIVDNTLHLAINAVTIAVVLAA